MAHIYNVTFALESDPSTVSRTQQVRAMAPALAQRYARHLLELDHAWQLHECQDLGAWNHQPITAD
jgi:hypothetical protein